MRTTLTRGGRLTTLALVLALVATLGSLLATRPTRAAAIFTVNLTGDAPDFNTGDGKCDVSNDAGLQCTLRAAIEQANATGGADTIRFNIPGAGVHAISPAAPLPPLTRQVTIDGYTQPGAEPNTAATGTNAKLRIVLEGSVVGGSGLLVQGSNSLIRGLVINRFGQGGVEINGASTTGVRVEGCFLGTNVAGTVALPNAVGVVVRGGSAATVVGGTTPAARNLVAGNRFVNIDFIDAGPDGVVQGNLIGSDHTGSGRLANTGPGLLVIDGQNVTVGGNGAAGNVIAFNGGAGVAISGDSATGNRILRNAIFANDGLGIDLGLDDGPTANDLGDGDTGPNDLQNKPVLDAATTAGGATTIEGRLNSTPNADFVVRFYANPPGGNEGTTFLGQASVTTKGGGNAVFTFKPAQPIAKGQTVTATATSADGNTSEFSLPVAIA